MPNRLESKRALFVWDGTRRSISIADRVLSTRDEMAVSCLLVLPHESICAYATPGNFDLEPLAPEQRIHSKFQKVTANTERLGDCNLEISFGDRISGIVRYSEIVSANTILMPKFQQSMFSNWIHGDLNRRIKEKADCEIIFYDSESETWAADLGSSKIDEENSL